MSNTWHHISDLAQQALAEAEIRTEFPEIRGLQTGVPEIDEKMSPALDAGRLVVIAGESGRGKTAMAAQFAAAFAHQVPVLWLSLEDDKIDATRRLLANLARVPVSGLRNGFKLGSVPNAVRTGVDTVSDMPLFIQSETDHVMGIARTTATWVAKHGAKGPIRGVLIVDQLSHILPMPYDKDLNAELERKGLPVPPRQTDNDVKVLEWQIAVLREIAVRLNMLVVVLHQLNQVRDDDGRPSMSSVRGSQGIVHKADLVVIPYRPRTIANPFSGPGQPKTVEAEQDAAELICVKGRVVSAGWSVKLRFDGAHQRFVSPNEAPTPDGHAPAYEAPEAFSDRAMEGAKRLADLRAKLELQRSIERRTAGELEKGTEQ